MVITGRRTIKMPSVEGVDDDSPAKGYGLHGKSEHRDGVYGESDGIEGMGFGVHGKSDSAIGVYGESKNVIGVHGHSSTGTGVYASSGTGRGVYGSSGGSYGVYGESSDGEGVYGHSDYGDGVHGGSGTTDPSSDFLHDPLRDVHAGVRGQSKYKIGVHGQSEHDIGVYGYSSEGEGVYGYNSGGAAGVVGHSFDNVGVWGESYKYGVFGIGWGPVPELSIKESHGVHGESWDGVGVYGYTGEGVGVYGECSPGGYFGWAARFKGRVDMQDQTLYVGGIEGSSHNHLSVGGNVTIFGDLSIRGNLSKDGGGFKIDHPLDPANKYLCHSFVESPDMKNVYDGVVVLDNKGQAEIQLPDWFGALNKDFRYQLTAIGAPGPNLYIAEEIISDTSTTSNNSSRHDDDDNGDNNNGNRFKIAGGNLGMKVSWQVTGIRKDPWAIANRIQIEEDKPDKQKGYYIYPDLYGQPEDKDLSSLLFPEQKRKMQELLKRGQA
jgi:hypothetical protein